MPRAVVRAQRAAMQQLAEYLQVQRLGAVARQVTQLRQLQIECSLPVLHAAPISSLGADITLKSPDESLFVQLSLQASLVTRVVNALMEREAAREDPRQALDQRTLGLLSALVVEVAGRAACGMPLVLHDGPPLEASGGVLVSLGFGLDDQRYAGVAWLTTTTTPSLPSRPSLAALHDLPIRVALCVGVGSARRVDLEQLAAGDVWLPGAGYWLRDGQGFAALVAPTAEVGTKVELTRSGVVYHGDPVTIPNDAPADPEASDPQASEGASTTAELSDIVLDSPLVVRLELGAVSLTAREWASVNVGDVLETRQPIGSAVVLRVAGKEVASGQLVTVDGEIGVRITQIRR